jgi:type IV pilus assembly protein PilM
MLFGNNLVAVDIGSSAVKMLELSTRGNVKKLKNFAMEALPQSAFENGKISDPDAIVKALKRCVSKLGAKGRRASISVSGKAVFLKKVRLSPGRDSTIDEQANSMASQIYDLNEIYYDYAEMGVSHGSNNEVDVIISGVRRDLIEQYIAIIKAAGLQPGIIEAGALSLANMFEINYGIVEGLIALISIGASYTQLNFIENGSFLYSQEIAIGGDSYTASIMSALNVQHDKAEIIKIESSANPTAVTPDVRKIFEEGHKSIVDEIRRGRSTFVDSMGIDGTSQLKFAFVTGGASRTVGLDAAIAAALGVPVYSINPFQKIELNEKSFKLEQMMALSPFLGVCVGLGLRENGDKVAV